ncbi:tetratricopeptide repeat protein [Fluviicola sp.]|uniref:tetratricopeptide repeat-containing sensor histidine kinase n=1 Tax=Fluviicola sp. TaxID=1917219 RepID=UPI0031E3ACF4
MKPLLCCFLLLSGGFLHSQTQQQLDSLEHLVPKKNGKEKVQLLNDLTFYYHENNAEKAIRFGEQALKLAKTLRDDRMLANTYNDFSMPFHTRGDFQKSVELNQAALNIRLKLRDTMGIISSQAKLGSAYNELTQYKKAQQAYNEAIRLARIKKDEGLLLHLYQNSANVLEISGYVQQALEMQKDVQKLALKSGDTSLIINNYGNLGNCYRKLKNFPKSREMYLKAIPLIKEHHKLEQLSMVYQGLGVLERDAGNTDLGLEYYKKSFRLYKQIDSKTGEGIVAVNIGNSYKDLGNFDSAEVYLKHGLELVKDTRSFRQTLLAYRALAELEIKKKNFEKATEYLKLQSQFQDSVSLHQGNEVLSEMFTKYEVAKKEQELAESEAKIAKNRFYKAVWTGVSATLFLFFILVFLFFRHKRKLAQEELIRTKQEEQFLREKQLNEQKLSISRELHDNIGSQITYLISSIDNLSYLDEHHENLNHQLRNLSDFGRNTMLELRSTIWAMNLEEGTTDTLISRIESVKSKIPIPVDIQNNLKTNYPLKATELLNLYRVTQEAIQNTLKYAEAKQVIIRFEETNPGFRMTVSDNGKGIQSATPDGNGLRNMRYRCEQIGASFELHTQPGQGTSVSCTFSHLSY